MRKNLNFNLYYLIIIFFKKTKKLEESYHHKNIFYHIPINFINRLNSNQ
ncbi:hypothetical protein EU92_1839 [Prochlorococcus marinus str. MIT 9107]|nr:hypothetical protein EU92_1839 [Prochlorococcus marinus str. MIT 9107]KGF95476.1 hypothetical protein EU94_0185 [Prochlorococcus marinus str. MIT 9123]